MRMINRFAEKYVPGYTHELKTTSFQDAPSVIEEAGKSVAASDSFKAVTVHVDFGCEAKVLAAVLWHPARIECWSYLSRALQCNEADAVFYISNVHKLDRRQAGCAAQVVGNVEMENFFLAGGYSHFWSLHSDIIPPPFALKTLLEDNVCIVSAVTPKPGGTNSYLNYYDESLPDTWWMPNGMVYPHHYLYALLEPTQHKINPGGRILPYDKRLVEVAGTGWGSLLMTRKVVAGAGENVYHDFWGHFDDGYWSWKIFKETPFKMYCDTTVRCYHLCAPLAVPGKNVVFDGKIVQSEIRKNTLFPKKWYGWSLKEYEN